MAAHTAYDLARQLAAALAVERPDLLAPVVDLLDKLNPCRPGPGFSCVRWYGKLFSLTPGQGRVVEVLWKARENGTPDVGWRTLANEAGLDSDRLQDAFKNSDAWGGLVTAGKQRGTYRLADESPGPAPADEE